MPRGWQGAKRNRVLAGLLLMTSWAVGAQAAELDGVVRSDAGTPAGAGWRVVVQSIDDGRSTVALTDAAGAFRLRDLPDGRTAVTVYATAVGELTADPKAGRLLRLSSARTPSLDFVVKPNGAAAPTFNFTYYRPEYWQDKATEETADAVNLPAGGTTGNIDMQLAVGGGTISGRVTRDVGGTGIAGLIVTAFGNDTGIFSFDRTDQDGFYRITGIPADGFVVTAGLAFGDPESPFVGEYYNNSYGIGPATIVMVNDGADTGNIDFSLGNGATISGRVTAQNGGAGLPNALVSLYEPTLGLGAVDLTDAQGNYTARRLAPGSWKVGVNSGDNHVPEFWNDKPTFDMADLIPVTAGSTTNNIDLALADGGRIRGTITNQTTTAPLEDILVLAERTSDGLTAVAISDETGSYEVDALPAGTYTVYVPELGEYWDNQGSEETANPVVVALGQIVENIDFSGIPLAAGCSSAPEDVGTVRGTVLDAGLDPIADAEVSLAVDVLGTRFTVDQVDTDANGDYEFACVTPGTYYVQVAVPYTQWLAEWYNDADEAGADPVTVTANQLTDNIDFTLAAGVSISGRITAPGGAAIAGVEVSAKNRDTDNTSSEITDANGEYVINVGPDGGLPGGAYTVWAQGHSTADASLVPVVLASFTAARVDGGVSLAWTTGHENNHAGFHVERSAAPNGPAVRLTARLLTDGPEYRFVDDAPLAGDAWYWLVAVDRDGRSERLGPLAVGAGVPTVSRLLGPAVNPSRNAAAIRYEMAREGRLTLQVFDAAGRWVRTLVDGVRPAGPGQVTWDGATADGASAAAGLYFLKFTTPDSEERGRLALVR
jgi:hypothetical protein